jgi:hypothetical protein
VSVREVDAAWRRRERREWAEERERELRLALSSNLGGCTASAIWIQVKVSWLVAEAEVEAVLGVPECGL